MPPMPEPIASVVSLPAARVPVWLRVVIVLAIPLAAYGIYLRAAALPSAFCRSPDELAEMMPGIRLHALPLLNVRDALRYNFLQSMFYSQHGLGDVSFYYLASGLLSLAHLPVSERFLFLAGGVTNLALALAGVLVGTRLLRSSGAGWVFATLVLVSPFFVFVSRSGWGRLTWTPLLLLALFLAQWQAMRRRGILWPIVYCLIAGAVSLTDGFMNLPIVVILGLLLVDGSVAARVKSLARDRVFLAGVAVFALGLAIDLLIGLAALRRGTDLTLLGYVMLRGSHGSLIPSRDAWSVWSQVIDLYFPCRGAWLAVTAICALAFVEGLRGRTIGFVAAWWLLASAGLIRYLAGVESMGRSAAAGWLNASGSLAVPSLLLVAWFIASVADGVVPGIRRWRPLARGALALAFWLAMIARLAYQSDLVAFGDPLAFVARGLTVDQISQTSEIRLGACRTVKAAAFYARSRQPALPYVFHLSSNVHLGHIGEFYYGLSYGRSLRPEDPNHLLDFGGQTGQFTRPHFPEEFARVYGVDHFDYYVDFADDQDPLKPAAVSRLIAEGAREVCTIRDRGRLIGRILSFNREPPIELDARTASASWDRQFGRAGTLLLQPLAGTAYHFGYNWRSPE